MRTYEESLLSVTPSCSPHIYLPTHHPSTITIIVVCLSWNGMPLFVAIPQADRHTTVPILLHSNYFNYYSNYFNYYYYFNYYHYYFNYYY
eukprot:gene10551-biopygen2115